MKIIKENKNVENNYLKKNYTTKQQEEDILFNEEKLLPHEIKSDNLYTNKNMQNFSYRNNSNICYRFGQVNVEKSLFVLIFEMLFTATVIYFYVYQFEKAIIYLYFISSGFDFLLMTILIYFIVKFRQEEIFSSFSRSQSNLVEIINTINFLFKSINLGILFFFTNNMTFFFCFLFTIKFFLDLYFVIITLKIFLFCTCTLWINENLYRFTCWILSKFNFEIEEEKEDDKEKLEELESIY